MNREEAIEVLSQDLPCEHDTDLIEALKIAIRALEQEPYDDAKYHEEHGEVIVDKAVWEDAKRALEPYKGMTNGQVHDMLYQMLVELKDGADRYGAEKWWNSPYEPQKRSE